MKSVVYSGPSDAVETITEPLYVFPRGVAVDTPDDLADSLCAQDFFNPGPAPTPDPAASAPAPAKTNGDK